MKSKKLFFFNFIITALILTACSSQNNLSQNNKIPIFKSVEENISGAAGKYGKVNIKNSPYYNNKLDFYNSSPTKTLIKLDKFKTYQQTCDWSCGACCALMGLNYFGINDISEKELVEEMDIRSFDNPREDGSIGATTDSIVNVFKNRGFNVTSSFDTQNENGISFDSFNDFSLFVKSKLKENSVMIVENVEWGGHWRVIIGYDDMGEPDNTPTHVLIFADSYDTTAHNQNGYTIGSAERFFDSWFDHDVMPSNQRIQQYICVSK